MQRTGVAGVSILVGTGRELGAGAGSVGAERAGGLLAKGGTWMGEAGARGEAASLVSRPPPLG